jgi:glycosyltransferase involved in cell wall biosynthesis
MRVLYVDHTGLVSGAQWALLDLMAALPSGVEPVVMCPRGPLADLAEEAGAAYVEFPGTRASLRLHPIHTSQALLDAARSVAAIRRTVRRERIDVVHANSLRAGLLAARLRSSGAGAPVVVHLHDALPPGRTTQVVRGLLHRGTDAAIAISEYTRRNYVGGRSGLTVPVLYNPLDADRFDPARLDRDEARRRLGVDPDVPLVGMVAQITPWKGQDTAIKAMAEVRRRHPDARLLIAGESKFAQKGTRYDNLGFERDLKALVAQHGLDQCVQFLGEVRDVPVLVRALDVALSPSWAEPFGRSVMEAMALEAYTIATAVGGPPEFLQDGVQGRTLDPHDVGAWAEAVSAALDDPASRREAGRRASAAVRERFERGRYAGRVVELYETLRGQQRRHGRR